MSNSFRQEDNEGSFSSQIAEKMYSKIKPEIESLKSNNVQEQKFQPPVIKKAKSSVDTQIINNDVEEEKTTAKETPTTSKIDKFIIPKKVELADETVNQEEPKTTTIVEQDTTVKPIESENANESGATNEDYKHVVEKTVTFGNDSKVYEIRKHKNNTYFVPKSITEQSFNKIIKDLPNGVNVDNFINYFKTEGLTQMNQSLEKYIGIGNTYNRYLNDWFIKANTAHQNQKGNALKTNWIFKNFF